MPEWSTYRLEDLALFPARAYWRLIERYGSEIWPAQLLAVCCAIALVALAVRAPSSLRSRAISAILGGAWLFVAFAFFLERYASLHWAAKWFALGFAAQALLLLATGLGGSVRFGGLGSAPRAAGFAITLFALLVHPVAGPIFGRSWRAIEMFGIHADPTALATLGIILVATGRARWLLLVIPVAWCLVTGATLLSIDAPDAMTAPLVAAAAVAIAIWKELAERRRQLEDQGVIDTGNINVREDAL